MKITRTFDLLDRYAQHYNIENVLNAKEKGIWRNYSTTEYIELAHSFAYGLMALGFQRGDKIITVSNNRPEWNFVDIGMSMLGVIHVPVFTSLSTNEYLQILSHSAAKIILVSDHCLYKRIEGIFKNHSVEVELYSFDQLEGVKNWREIVESGRLRRDEFIEKLENIKLHIKETDFATLIYTSGTTGDAKGVMLSHQNLVQNFIAASEVFGLGPNDKYLSILPLCHVGGRMGNYQTQYSGCPIYYAENMGTIAANMKEIKPQGFDAVPRILEKIFDNVIAKGKTLKGIKKKMFFWAVSLGLRYQLPEDSTWWYKKQHALADQLIFSKWREALGGNIKICGCGGASLQPRLERVFWASGIKILNMYGLTETSPIITINRSDTPLVKLGTVGALIDGVKMKIAEDGEILCKGHNVMLGYFKNPELTAQVIDEDGWFHTGDIGKITHGKFLEITDRKKEIFKLSSGKFVAPQVIEGKLKESVFIEHAMVIGEQEKHASALIVPNFSYLTNWCKENDLPCIKKRELIFHPKIAILFNQEIKRINRDLNQHEKILRYRLVTDSWSPESGELSPTLKLRRKFILEKYADEILKIYLKKEVV
ncbi:MAG: long-chain fatty acid--CoA ligase [Prolixibacteraceae bacterium]